MVGLLSGENWSKGGEREVNTWEATVTNKTGTLSLGSRSTTYGTKLVWNSLRSTFKDPSKRSEAVIEETT